MRGGWGLVAFCTVAFVQPAGAQFMNFEIPHVSPVDMTPDGNRLLVVNTPDNRLDIYDLTSGTPEHVNAVTVGLRPCSVRSRTNTEAWVVNAISDSVSIVDLTSGAVTHTILTGDEPADVCFAGVPERAFVSVSQLNQVKVYSTADPSLAPIVIDVAGEDPRALVTDGTNVAVAIFESGNGTTILDEPTVSSALNPYSGDPNPPPNDGAGFTPAINPLTAPKATGLIVKKAPGDMWVDDNGGDWTGAVTWDLNDHDVLMIDATSLNQTYVRSLMNIVMAIAMRGSEVTTVGTDATNEIRFEPNVNGTFLRVNMGSFDPATPSVTTVVDLNPHLDYLTNSVAQPVRDQGIGDPRGIVWNAAGTRGYVSGMGSNNVIIIDSAGARLGRIEVGEGPTGLALDEARSRLYVLNKFAGSISVVDTTTDTVVDTLGLPMDPTPPAVRDGRKHLYDTHKNSGLGIVSCASCHIDGRMDQLGWDLSVPNGDEKAFNQTCTFFQPLCENWQPMKGPLVTQTLFGIIGTEPLHWRGDREDLNAFNIAFTDLLSDDVDLEPAEMSEFINLVATFEFPPNPYRNIDNSLPTTSPFGGNPQAGASVFTDTGNFDGVFACSACHSGADATNSQIIHADLMDRTQDFKVPQLRNLYQKTGFVKASDANNRGFGYGPDGSDDTLINLLNMARFTFDPGAAGDQDRIDVQAFLMAFSDETHAGIGAQTMVVDGANVPVDQQALLATMLALADAGEVGLIAKGLVSGESRGWAYQGGDIFFSDRLSEMPTSAQLQALATPAGPITYTLVPVGTEFRNGVDRDLDGWFDQDEEDTCTDPSDPNFFPGHPQSFDQTGDGIVNVDDLLQFLSLWFQGFADFTGDGMTNIDDLLAFLAGWFECSS